MTWAEANAYCQQQGGRLPLVNGRERANSRDMAPTGTPVEGFGKDQGPWPAGLPGNIHVSYWTGTKDAQDYPWVVTWGSASNSANLAGSGAFVRNQFHAVCVR